jgi:hypothetical protein
MGAATRVLLAVFLCAGCTATVRDVCETVTTAWCDKFPACGIPWPTCQEEWMASCCKAHDCEQEIPSWALDAAESCAVALAELDCDHTFDPAGMLPKECQL